MTNSVECTNFSCYENDKGNCQTTGTLYGQIGTIGNQSIKRQFTKVQFEQTIKNFETRRLNVLCRDEDEALRNAISYAKNILAKMPETES